MPDSSDSRYAPTKVPEITLYFWVVKVLTTGAGESTSDYLIERLHVGIAVPLAGIALAVALVLQFSARRYEAWTYWSAVVMVAVFGTMAADVLHGGLGIPYIASTLALAVVLAAIFAAWYWTEKTLSIHSIHTRRREAFYWATVMATFALGTAAGDLTATTFGWGYFYSGVMFTVAIAAVACVHFIGLRISPAGRHRESTFAVLTFWLAYILTRPLGASFADWMGKPAGQGALGWGDGTVSLSLLIVIVALVAYLAVGHRRVAGAQRVAERG
jgi:uncharacterized membrane-anchored protein